MAGDLVTEKPLHLPTRFGDLPARWVWLRLDDACIGVFDCPHSTPRLVDAGPLVVRSQDIITGVFRAEQAAHVSEETYKERTSRVIPARGDLLYSREGTYFGIAAEVPAQTRVCLGQRMVLIRPRPDVVDFRFLCRWLNSTIMASHIHGYRDGTVAERLNLPTIRALPVLVPPLPDQSAIAHILGTLDDKIELNRRMNETLEAMARALFKSWFVDFDPVRAKAEGCDPGLPKHIADLFPDSFENSALGLVPGGWQARKWGDLVSLEYGKSLSGYDQDDGVYAVYGTNGKIGTHSVALCSHPGVIVGRKGAYRGVHYCEAPFFVIDTAFYVEPKVPLEMRWIYYELLQMDINSMDSGSAIPSTSRQDFYGVPAVAPPFPVQDCFAKFLEPMWRRRAQNEIEAQTLSALRDTLLPKLISGELRIQDAERFVSESVA
jgi:type I restriction enzyme, S subunit